VLTSHEESVGNSSRVVCSQVEEILEDDSEKSPKVFILKSIAVSWEGCEVAYLHVVSDISYIKELEKEKATNE